jgi:hypothetical protein
VVTAESICDLSIDGPLSQIVSVTAGDAGRMNVAPT